MRFTIDTNILVYAFIREEERKHAIAADLMIRAAMADVVVAAQTLGEFIQVIRRREPQLFEEAVAQAQRWLATMTVLETRGENVLSGAKFAARYKLQLWDSIIWQVARAAHAVVFLTEDLQDGLSLEGMRVINPFRAENQVALQELLPG